MPHSKSTCSTLTTGTEVEDLPSLVTNVHPGSKEIERKKVTMWFGEQASSEPEDELTPFKKLVAGKWESSVDKPTQFNRVVYDHAESDEPTQFQRGVGKHKEPSQFQEAMPVSKEGKGKAQVHPCSDAKHVQPIPVISRPKPRPLKQTEPHAPPPMHVKAALKAATELNVTDELDTNELLQFIAVFKIVGTATPHELFEQFITTVFNYCIFHVTFPCHIFQRFMIKISNCNYSLIS